MMVPEMKRKIQNQDREKRLLEKKGLVRRTMMKVLVLPDNLVPYTRFLKTSHIVCYFF